MTTLDGIRVLDLSRVLAGPWATQTLADLGATVIKIEKPGTGDDTREWGPPFVGEGKARQSTYFLCCNRGKQSVTVDFTRGQGGEIIRRLVAQSDVLVENFKVGGLAKYGLDYDSLRELNPKLIYCSITGFGQTGPYAHRQGYDALIQAMGGLMSLTGEPEGEPQKVGVAVTDLMTGMYASTAILAALYERTRSGQGQHIDLSLMGVQVATLANQGSAYLATQKNPSRRGNAHPSIVPYQAFATKDGQLMLTVANDLQFKNFCGAAGLVEESRFSSNENRVLNRQVLVELIGKKLKEKTTEEWVALSQTHGFSCGPINTLEQVFRDRHVRETAMVETLKHASLESVQSIRNPIRLSRTPVDNPAAPPTLGQNTQAVLRDLGFSDSQIEELRRRSII